MTLPDMDPEDKLLFPEGTEPTINLFKNIPGGAVTISVLALTALASFGLGMLAEHSIEGSTGLTGAANSAITPGSSLTAPDEASTSQDPAVKGSNMLNTAMPSGNAGN
jgi:hypothetical protein